MHDRLAVQCWYVACVYSIRWSVVTVVVLNVRLCISNYVCVLSVCLTHMICVKPAQWIKLVFGTFGSYCQLTMHYILRVLGCQLMVHVPSMHIITDVS